METEQVLCPEDDSFLPDAAALDGVARSGADVVIVCSPNNPGTGFSATFLPCLMRWDGACCCWTPAIGAFCRKVIRRASLSLAGRGGGAEWRSPDPAGQHDQVFLLSRGASGVCRGGGGAWSPAWCMQAVVVRGHGGGVGRACAAGTRGGISGAAAGAGAGCGGCGRTSGGKRAVPPRAARAEFCHRRIEKRRCRRTCRRVCCAGRAS